MFKGSQVQLSRPDYSGFANASRVEAESMARIGATIAGAVKSYQEKKEKKEAEDAYVKMMQGFSQADNPIGEALRQQKLDDPENIRASAKALGHRELLTVVNQFATLNVEQDYNNQRIANEQAKIAARGNETVDPAQPTLNEMEDFKKYLASLGGMKDLIVKNGRLYDKDFLSADDFIPMDDPIVQELMNLEGVRDKFLFGYEDPAFLGTEPTEIPTTDTVPVDSFIATDPIKPVGLRLPERTSDQRGFGY